VVLEKRGIIDSGLDAENKTKLVIHLDGHRSHVMLDAGSFYPGAEVVAQFILIMTGELPSKECGDLVGFHGVYGRSGDGFIDDPQISLSFEHHIRGILDLQEAPVIGNVQLFDYRAIEPGIFIKTVMKLGNIQAVR
jgi:hypothetical protein